MVLVSHGHNAPDGEMLVAIIVLKLRQNRNAFGSSPMVSHHEDDHRLCQMRNHCTRCVLACGRWDCQYSVPALP